MKLLRSTSLLLALLALAPAPFEAAGTAPDARAILRAYNDRNFGSPGWRRIYLELRNRGVVSRTFTILHLWQRGEAEVRSLVLLEDPAGLKGTNYLLVENDRTPGGMELYLHLPAGKRQVLTIKPGRFDEGLLGSDFTYSDLRWQIPLRHHRLQVLGQAKLLGRPVAIVEVAPETPEAREATAWACTHYYIASEPSLLLGADYFPAAAGGKHAPAPAKRLRIEGVERGGKAWTPTRMTMTVTRGRTSVLTLKGFEFNQAPFDAALFQPDVLPTVAETLKGNWQKQAAQGSRR